MAVHNKRPDPAFLLKGAAAVIGLVGLSIAVWLADKAIHHPEIHASQLGHMAPLWIPMMVFVAGCTGVIVLLFLRTARRVEAGDDLFARRHRRRVQDEM
ncbi:MAG TPA: ABC transporter permease [Rhodothermales bacterium]|nr:ABC transporter permease [Rhodothermales bacterium]